MARIAYAGNAPDEARAWIARAAGAPQEADWSDLDPEGHAFAYDRHDWARLVSTYAETGEMAHPRYERGDRTLSELPQLPAAYSDSAPFIRAVAAPAAAIPIPDDPGPLSPEENEPETDQSPRAPRRRLASRPRAAK
jgi:HemY protein